MVGKDLTIRRFTPQSKDFLGLIASDVGRPLMNINPLVEIPNFHAQLLQVLADSRSVEQQIVGQNHAPYLMRIFAASHNGGQNRGGRNNIR
jgi:two-component system CheB/CheR fusion protein